MTAKLKYGLILGLITMTFGCGNSEEEIKEPEGILDRAKFVQVFAQVQILDAAYKQKVYKKRDARDFISSHYSRLFEAENVTRDEFITTYKWYASQPELMLGIYDDVILEITTIEAKLTEKDQ